MRFEAHDARFCCSFFCLFFFLCCWLFPFETFKTIRKSELWTMNHEEQHSHFDRTTQPFGFCHLPLSGEMQTSDGDGGVWGGSCFVSLGDEAGSGCLCAS